MDEASKNGKRRVSPELHKERRAGARQEYAGSPDAGRYPPVEVHFFKVPGDLVWSDWAYCWK